MAFYVSDVYAPLMKIRHAATDPRFLVMARAGALPAEARAAARELLALASRFVALKGA